MSGRSKRSGAQPTTPALVSNATPADAAPAPGGVLPVDATTTPAVPSTEPLPSDQATAADVRPGEADVIAEVAAVTGERPSIVPETPSVEEATAPTAPASQVRGTVVRERVGSDVPLPADQITPELPVAAPASFREALAAMSPDDREALREWLGVPQVVAGELVTADELGDELFQGTRSFRVAYDVDHDGRSYAPGDPIELTFDEYRRFARASAIAEDWLRGEVVA